MYLTLPTTLASLQEACDHVRKCRVEVLPLQTFLDQLSVWESHVVHDDVP